jgi:polyisoprenoid-binding protein YceI
MKRIAATALLLAFAATGYAQKYMTRTGKVTFFSSTPVENIEAINNEAAAAVDASNGEMLYQVPIKSFRFQNQLMQEHFNENYMESDKFPKATFKGKLANLSAVNFQKDGSYPASATGQLTIHGVTKTVTIPGTIVVSKGQVTANSKFNVKTADYGIKIPGVAAGKIAESIEVTVNTILAAR